MSITYVGGIVGLVLIVLSVFPFTNFLRARTDAKHLSREGQKYGLSESGAESLQKNLTDARAFKALSIGLSVTGLLLILIFHVLGRQ